MARSNTTSSQSNPNDIRPGSSVEEARKMGGKGDFGVPESNVAERTYTSENTRRSDPGAAPARAGSDGSRTSEVGGNISGAGSSSGGDLDPDIIGFGTGGGIAASGKIHEPAGPDDATESSRGLTSKRTVKADQERRQENNGGSTVQPPDDRTASGVGADAISRSEVGDDSFAGEVSSDEASGRNDAGD